MINQCKPQKKVINLQNVNWVVYELGGFHVEKVIKFYAFESEPFGNWKKILNFQEVNGNSAFSEYGGYLCIFINLIIK